MCIDSTIHVFIHLNIHRLNANSSIAISNTEQGTKFTRVNNHRLRNFAESRRLFRVNWCYPGLIMIISFILHTHDPSPELKIVLVPVVVKLIRFRSRLLFSRI